MQFKYLINPANIKFYINNIISTKIQFLTNSGKIKADLFHMWTTIKDHKMLLSIESYFFISAVNFECTHLQATVNYRQK